MTKNTYAIVDLSTRTLVEYPDGQSAWTAWQNCWMKGNGLSIHRYTMGKVNNMRKYLNPKTPNPLSYNHDDLPSTLEEQKT